ncbi:MAG: helix-turn-helix domain-containing protein [Xanthomonadales bacterium]|nr:helix-turn-helix domain-containing protein [Xanthomonadales bacterium]
MRIDPDLLRRLREQRAWSQEQLAEVAGLSVRTVQRVENGAAASLETRMALAAALDVEPAGLCAPAAAAQTDAGERTNRASGGHRGPDGEERAFRATVVALGVGIVFALLLLFGYLLGGDLADKANYRDCVAEGRSDCR